jgi:hypothetical protein
MHGNAKLIVAAPETAAELSLVKAELDKQDDELEAVEAQRDELLAAAKAVIADTSTTKEPFPSAIVRQSSIKALQAAIAAATVDCPAKRGEGRAP